MNRLIAVAVFVFVSVIFVMTAGPSIAFWDCGEFLASCGCLGLPHPPGTPLLIPIGRMFLVVFSFLKDAGFRANLMAVFGSAAVAMLIYAIIVRSLIFAFGEPDTMWKRLTLYCSGVVGSLFCAFGNTFWFCSMEGSEQCNFCLLPVALTIWLVLIWAKSTDERYRDRLLLLIAYIGYAGIGMHMISMITLPAIFLFVMIYDKNKRYDWRLWLFGLCLSLAMVNLSWFIMASSASIVFTFIMMLVGGRKTHPKWGFAFWFLTLAMLGFSNHVYLPVRSSVNPAIDENHPVTWKAFSEMLDRKQYGSESMITRSLWRRGTLEHQFGIEGNMGYGGFHITQFFHFSLNDTKVNFMENGDAEAWGKLLVYLLPTFFMLFGWFYFYRRDKKIAFLLIFVTLLTTVIMAWYMNFSDGLRPEHQDYLQWMKAGQPGPEPLVHREVRVRDYFYNAGFMFFGMWIGVAAGCLLYALFSSKNMFFKRIAPVLLVLFFVSPALPLTQNYKVRDRHTNWVPYDYAYNLLMSCEKDAVLITNGDNDTFPLWAIQQAFGFRKDVRIVNLSLANTDWYVKQIKSVEPKVAMTFSDDQITELSPEYNPFERPTPYTLPDAGITITLPGREQMSLLRAQDKVVLNIVNANKWRKPIYFAITVSDDNFIGLGPYLQNQGMCMRIMQEPVTDATRYNLGRSEYLLNNVYRYRLPRINEYTDETVRGMLIDYSICFLQAGFAYRDSLAHEQSAIVAKHKAGADASALENQFNRDFNAAIALLDKGIKATPQEIRLYQFQQELLVTYGKFDVARAKLEQAMKENPGNSDIEMLMRRVEAIANRAAGSNAMPVNAQ